MTNRINRNGSTALERSVINYLWERAAKTGFTRATLVLGSAVVHKHARYSVRVKECIKTIKAMIRDRYNRMPHPAPDTKRESNTNTKKDGIRYKPTQAESQNKYQDSTMKWNKYSTASSRPKLKRLNNRNPIVEPRWARPRPVRRGRRGGGRGAGGANRTHPPSWANYFKIMQFFTRN